MSILTKIKLTITIFLISLVVYFKVRLGITKNKLDKYKKQNEYKEIENKHYKEIEKVRPKVEQRINNRSYFENRDFINNEKDN